MMTIEDFKGHWRESAIVLGVMTFWIGATASSVWDGSEAVGVLLTIATVAVIECVRYVHWATATHQRAAAISRAAAIVGVCVMLALLALHCAKLYSVRVVCFWREGESMREWTSRAFASLPPSTEVRR